MAQRRSGRLQDLKRFYAVDKRATAVAALEAGELRNALRLAFECVEAAKRADECRSLVPVFLAGARGATAESRFADAVRALQWARRLDPQDEYIQRRLESAVRSEQSHSTLRITTPDGTITAASPTEVARYRVITFAEVVTRRMNYRIGHIGERPVLECARHCSLLNSAKAPLPELGRAVGSFFKVGVYRWRGDPNLACDEFSRMLNKFKDGAQAIGEQLGWLFGEALLEDKSTLRSVDLVVPVPGDPERTGPRGFNPPTVLAAAVSEATGLPLFDVLLKRRSVRARELGWADVAGNYSADPSKASIVAGRSVLLVDDVATRGYTLTSCADVLRKAGADSVHAAVLAQAISSHREDLARAASGGMETDL